MQTKWALVTTDYSAGFSTKILSVPTIDVQLQNALLLGVGALVLQRQNWKRISQKKVQPKEQAMDNRNNFYKLPYRTEEILKGFKPEEECKNLGLLLDKYMPKSVFEKAGKALWLSEIFRPHS